MKRNNLMWLFPAVVFCMVIVAGALVVLPELVGEEESLFSPLFDFCWEQRQEVIDDCADWAFTFIDVYGDAAADCLHDFDSDSSLLAMCIDNIEAGK
jgi:hypothetical protein